jgi:uncharacterized protein YcaQ
MGFFSTIISLIKPLTSFVAQINPVVSLVATAFSIYSGLKQVSAAEASEKAAEAQERAALAAENRQNELLIAERRLLDNQDVSNRKVLAPQDGVTYQGDRAEIDAMAVYSHLGFNPHDRYNAKEGTLDYA